MRPQAETEAPQRPPPRSMTTTVEIELAGSSIIHFRREAMRRDVSVARLVHDLLDAMRSL
jgi:hypothetical protein